MSTSKTETHQAFLDLNSEGEKEYDINLHNFFEKLKFYSCFTIVCHNLRKQINKDITISGQKRVGSGKKKREIFLKDFYYMRVSFLKCQADSYAWQKLNVRKAL